MKYFSCAIKPITISTIRPVEFGLALLFSSYYISGILGNHFGVSVEFIASAYPLIFGGIVIIAAMARKRVLIGRSAKILTLYSFINILALISAFRSGASVDSVSFAARLFYSSIFLGIIAWLIASDFRFNLMRFYFCFCCVVSFIVAYVIFFGEAEGLRFSVSDRNPIYLSLLCALSFSISFLCIISNAKFGPIVYVAFISFLVMSFLGLIFSGGRGAILSVIATLFFYTFACLISAATHGKLTKSINVKALLPIIFAIFFGAYYFLDSRAVEGIFLLVSGDLGASGNERVMLLSQWVAHYEESPIFGVAFNSSLTYPHNIILELIFRFGVLGGLVSVILISFVIKYILFGFFSTALESKILSVLVSCSFISGLFSFSIIMMSYLFIFIVIASIYNSSRRRIEISRFPV
jgi:hypothetical protein